MATSGKQEAINDNTRAKPIKNARPVSTLVTIHVPLSKLMSHPSASLSCHRNMRPSKLHGEESWQSLSCSTASLSRNTNVHYRVHNSLSWVPTLSQINEFHVIPACFFNVHFNIWPVLSHVSAWSHSYRLSNQKFVRISHPPPRCVLHAPPLSHLIWSP
jgi:hypothetical protein